MSEVLGFDRLRGRYFVIKVGADPLVQLVKLEISQRTRYAAGSDIRYAVRDSIRFVARRISNRGKSLVRLVQIENPKDLRLNP